MTEFIFINESGPVDPEVLQKVLDRRSLSLDARRRIRKMISVPSVFLGSDFWQMFAKKETAKGKLLKFKRKVK